MGPIEKLFIYEIKGTVPDTAVTGAAGFLGCWREGDYSYLFFSKPGMDAVNSALAKDSALQYSSETVMNYDQWEPADALKPFTIGPLTVMPPWLSDGEGQGDTILLDPGVVFGAGSHHTTRMCLKLLLEIKDTEQINSLLDLGAGTGILSLAAARLGVPKVLAIDNNNLAVETAARNVGYNNLDEQVSCLQGDALEYIENDADCIIANIHLSVLKMMFLPDKKFQSKWFIVSGFNRTEVQVFTELIETLPLTIIRSEMDNLWSALLLRNDRI